MDTITMNDYNDYNEYNVFNTYCILNTFLNGYLCGYGGSLAAPPERRVLDPAYRAPPIATMDLAAKQW